MPISTPHPQTIVLVVLFAIIYLLVVLRKTVYGKFDLYDLIMLSMVAVVPLLFTLFPDIAALVSQLTGVLFPFIIMFGALFLVVFIFMHRMTARLHMLERQNCSLIQEVSLLAFELEEARKSRDRAT
jgi:hypothetical protein